MRRIHELKTIEPYFDLVWRGTKAFEVRKNDRDYKLWELLLLREYNPETKEYSGREILARITYILRDEEFCKPGYVVMQIRTLDMFRDVSGEVEA